MMITVSTLMCSLRVTQCNPNDVVSGQPNDALEEEPNEELNDALQIGTDE